MKWLIMFGKLATLGAWVMMGYNLLTPFDGNIGTLLKILLGVTVVMHSFQLGVFHLLFKKLLPLKASDYLQVFAFGVFALLEYRAIALAKFEAEARKG
ncbi:DUF1145 domain-containing protein [Shewanella amazonensis]|uniref:DUF1145 domain-containing protein n=1 Tax=Shewanella amazonensis (strain ATCC BAA-1098 / SB2B) TaxID=326297 RepID=A1SBB6_SHEAM|nr:DUF1145 domain-containing protein [Shewanella amazonensis]ABM01673.1 conserved hypothetical protein [Shewanella amazonensis SB2B]